MGPDIHFWIQILVYVVGMLVFIAINAYRFGHLESRLATKSELAEKVRDRNSMIERVYERFDEYKLLTNNDFVRKDMCVLSHSSSKEELKRIDEEYKAFRHEIRNTVQKIYDEIGHSNSKIDDLKELLLKR